MNVETFREQSLLEDPASSILSAVTEQPRSCDSLVFTLTGSWNLLQRFKRVFLFMMSSVLFCDEAAETCCIQGRGNIREANISLYEWHWQAVMSENIKLKKTWLLLVSVELHTGPPRDRKQTRPKNKRAANLRRLWGTEKVETLKAATLTTIQNKTTNSRRRTELLFSDVPDEL